MESKQIYSRTVYLLRKYIKNECSKEEVEELALLSEEVKCNEEIDVVTYSLWEAINRTIKSPDRDAEKLRLEATEITKKSKKRIRARKAFFTSSAVAIAAVVIAIIVLHFPIKIIQPNASSEHFLEQRHFMTENSIKKIILNDSSVVFLNKNTTLTIKEKGSNSETREVWLDEGEAFFEITKDPQRPFIVHTANGVSTQVLGTSFNIQAYSGLKRQIISVRTGRVEVNKKDGEKVVIDPDYQVTFDQTANTFTAGKTDGAMAAAWMEGKIVFQRTKMDEVALRIKQHFGVEIIYNGNQFKSIEYSAIFPAHTSVEEIAKSLSKVYDIGYSIKQDKLYLK